MKYDLYLFDLDGTICNSFDGIQASVSHMLKKLGIPEPSEEGYRSIIGPSFYYSMEHILHVPETLYETALDLYRNHFSQEGYRLFSIYEGVRNVLSSIRKAGGKVALATSKPIEPTRKLLRCFGLADHFDSVNAPPEDNMQNSKEYAIGEALKMPHQRAVMIGDRNFDGVGARFHGIDFVGVSYGFGSREELLDAGALALADSAPALLELFDIPLVEGKFISIEGMDGCGKTTQLELLQKKLKQYGFQTVLTREPGGTKISEEIRQILLSTGNTEMHPRTEALLYAASRSQHVQEWIKPNLSRGYSVLCDRFVDSSIAYQGGGRQLGQQNVRMVNDFAIDGLLPHRTIYLHMDAEKALARRAKSGKLDRLEREKVEFFLRTQAVYDKIAEENKERYILIDADDSIENIARTVFIQAASVLDEKVNWNECSYE